MKKKSKLDIIIQARIGSTRLKGKVLKNYKNLTPLKILIERLKYCKNINEIIICTTKLKEDKRIIKFCKKENIKYFKGSKNDVLSRYFFTAKKFKSDAIVKITSDCPLIDYRIINQMTSYFLKKKVDYYSNSYPLPTTYPDGMDIEIFNYKTLKAAHNKARLPSEREHVTPYMYNSGKFLTIRKSLKKDFSKFRFCIDYKRDFILLKKFINHFKKTIYTVSMYQLISFLKKKPNLTKYQKNINRNEGWASSLKKDEAYL